MSADRSSECACSSSCSGPSTISLLFAGLLLLGAGGVVDLSFWQMVLLLLGVVAL